MSSLTSKIGIIGAGAWGTALAIAMTNSGHDVFLWVKETNVKNNINNKNINSTYLPNIILPTNIIATNDLSEVIEQEVIFFVTPSKFIRDICNQIKEISITTNKKIIICSKGIEENSGLLISEIIDEILPNNHLLILSGPSFAIEVAHNLPTAVSLSCQDFELRDVIEQKLTNDNFKLIGNDDLIGAQICSTAKNILAIGCGILTGLNQDHNIRNASKSGEKNGEKNKDKSSDIATSCENIKAYLMTSSIKEIKQIIRVKGGNIATADELCGIGDIILTCSSEKSRNFSLGLELGKKRSLAELLSDEKKAVEGVDNAKSIMYIIKKFNIYAPILGQIFNILHDDAEADSLVDILFA